MALTTTVAKSSVRLVMPKMWAVSLTLTVTDDDGPGLTQAFSENYKLGNSIPELESRFDVRMQAAIDQYKTELQYYNHAQLDTLVTDVQAGLEV